MQRNGVMCEYAVLPWTKIIPAGDISPRDCALIEPMSVGFHAVSRGQVIDNDVVVAPEEVQQAMERWAAQPGKVFRILVKM